MNNILKKQPLFSIVVPAYNSAPFIKKCIESVLAQTCGDYELILVDDGSTDDTYSVCKNYAQLDSRIKVLHKQNGGHTSARNKGLKESVGKYIFFLDSDDWLEEQTLEICEEKINIHKSRDQLLHLHTKRTSVIPVDFSCLDSGWPPLRLQPTVDGYPSVIYLYSKNTIAFRM